MKKNTVCLLAAALVCLASSALAGPNKAKGLVVVVEGVDSEAVRDDLARGVPKGIGVEDGSELNLTLASQLMSGTLNDSLSNSRTRRRTLSTIHKALAQAGGALGVLVGQSKAGKAGTRELHVLLLVPSQIEPIVEEDFTLEAGETAASKVGPLVAATLDEPSVTMPPPAKPEASALAVPAGEATAPVSKDEGVTKPRTQADPTNAQVVLRAGPEIGTRTVTYTDYLYGAVRGYGLPGAAMVSVSGEIYPFANIALPFVKDIGLVGGYGSAFPWESKTRGGDQTADASWTRMYAGVRARFRVGDRPSDPLLGAQVSYGEWKFLFSGGAPVVSQTPAVDYKHLRFGGDVRVPFGPVAILGAAGALYIMSAGTFTDRFPRASIAGVDALVGGAYPFMPWLEARATAAYTRIFASVHPQPGDKYVAGGALDQYLVFQVAGAAYF